MHKLILILGGGSLTLFVALILLIIHHFRYRRKQNQPQYSIMECRGFTPIYQCKHVYVVCKMGSEEFVEAFEPQYLEERRNREGYELRVTQRGMCDKCRKIRGLLGKGAVEVRGFKLRLSYGRPLLLNGEPTLELPATIFGFTSIDASQARIQEVDAFLNEEGFVVQRATVKDPDEKIVFRYDRPPGEAR